MAPPEKRLKNVTFQLEPELLRVFKALCASNGYSMRARFEQFIMLDIAQSGTFTKDEFERCWNLASAAAEHFNPPTLK
ncbi:MAG: hypothetical protein RIT81_14895 [Deltaproteobacteria bacterium]